MSQQFNSESFANLYEWEKNHLWLVSRNARIIALINQYCKPPFKFLEIGCGTGFVINEVAAEFPGAEIIGAEYYKEGLFYAKKKKSKN